MLGIDHCKFSVFFCESWSGLEWPGMGETVSLAGTGC